MKQNTCTFYLLHSERIWLVELHDKMLMANRLARWYERLVVYCRSLVHVKMTSDETIDPWICAIAVLLFRIYGLGAG